MALFREWFTANDIAALGLPGVPTSARNVQEMADREDWRTLATAGKRWRKREDRGGGFEYHFSVLPPLARIEWVVAHTVEVAPPTQIETTAEDRRHAAVWKLWDQAGHKKQDEAKRRLIALDTLAALMREAGASKCAAVCQVAIACKVSPSTLRGWEALVRGVPRQFWGAYVLPRHTGRTATAECSEEAWEWIKAAYLRPERPAMADCYRSLVPVAAKQGWTIPSEDTLGRRMEQDVPHAVRVLARQGADALKQLYPAQQRSRAMLHAMEAVNADGHKIDVFVRWTDGEIIRPMVIVFQDLFSGKILSWRVDRSENLEAVRLAFGDLVEAFGVPDHCTLDNTRTFASKRLTGGISNRFRFKVLPDEPSGIMTSLGVQVHWATPYSGQSKPIERAFRDFASNVAKHPAFAGAYVGNKVDAKPENYGSKAVALDEFLAVLSDRIAEHNARPGRRSEVCGGEHSFDGAFEASYKISVIRKASEDQRLLWLMAASDVLVQRDGVHFHGNRYWHDKLSGLDGQKVTIRFDPDVLQDPIAVYRLDGLLLCRAECLQAAGFYDLNAAAEHGRKRRTWIKAKRAMLKAERTMDAAQVAALMPRLTEPPPPETKLVRLVHAAGNAVRDLDPDTDDELSEVDAKFLRYARAARAAGGGHLRVVEEED